MIGAYLSPMVVGSSEGSRKSPLVCTEGADSFPSVMGKTWGACLAPLVCKLCGLGSLGLVQHVVCLFGLLGACPSQSWAGH
ncbi:hypothetical protein V6N13_117018 [Hibiscus sabdariffa]